MSRIIRRNVSIKLKDWTQSPNTKHIVRRTSKINIECKNETSASATNSRVQMLRLSSLREGWTGQWLTWPFKSRMSLTLRHNTRGTPTPKVLNQGNGLMSKLNTKAGAQLSCTHAVWHFFYSQVKPTRQNVSASAHLWEQTYIKTYHAIKSTLCSDL